MGVSHFAGWRTTASRRLARTGGSRTGRSLYTHEPLGGCIGASHGASASAPSHHKGARRGALASDAPGLPTHGLSKGSAAVTFLTLPGRHSRERNGVAEGPSFSSQRRSTAPNCW